jgi:hypothetical protein
MPAALVGLAMWKPTASSSWLSFDAAPVVPEALATMITAPSVTSGIVVVVVGGRVVDVDVVDVGTAVVAGALDGDAGAGAEGVVGAAVAPPGEGVTDVRTVSPDPNVQLLSAVDAATKARPR